MRCESIRFRVLFHEIPILPVWKKKPRLRGQVFAPEIPAEQNASGARVHK